MAENMPIIGFMQEGAMNGSSGHQILYHQDSIPQRFPMSQEDVANTLISERRGEQEPSRVTSFFPEVLMGSIDRMVSGLCSQYSGLAGEDKEDLFQQCMSRIWDKLETFDSNKGKFTTWTWRVCMGIIWKTCRKAQHRRAVIVQSEGDLIFNDSDSSHDISVINREIADAVMALIHRYPKKKDIIVALFGDPTGMEFIPNHDVCLAEISRDYGLPLNDVSSFFRRKAQPFLKKRISGLSHLGRVCAKATPTVHVHEEKQHA